MTTWINKLNKVYIEKVNVLDKNFSDMKAGDKILISSPMSISSYISKIPLGQSKTIKEMRLDLAKYAGADNTCPLTTGIFLRIAIEAALEEKSITEVENNFPFWRVVNPKDNISKKLSIGVDYIKRKRSLEGI